MVLVGDKDKKNQTCTKRKPCKYAKGRKQSWSLFRPDILEINTHDACIWEDDDTVPCYVSDDSDPTEHVHRTHDNASTQVVELSHNYWGSPLPYFIKYGFILDLLEDCKELLVATNETHSAANLHPQDRDNYR